MARTGTGTGAGRSWRRAAGAAAAVAAVLAAAGCGGEDSGPLPRPEPDSARPDLAFSAQFHRSETSVGWSWTLRNDGDEPVLVLAGPDRSEPGGDAPTWVIGARGSTVELAQRLLAPPEGVGFDEPYGVVGSVLEPGGQVSGVAEAPLPLVTTLPWSAGIDPGRAVPDSPGGVYLCVGVGTAADFADQLAARSPYVSHEAWTAERQHQFCTDVEQLS